MAANTGLTVCMCDGFKFTLTATLTLLGLEDACTSFSFLHIEGVLVLPQKLVLVVPLANEEPSYENTHFKHLFTYFFLHVYTCAVI